MAKIGLNKVLSKTILVPKTILINNQEIQILQYLNIDDKVALIQRVLSAAADDTGTFSAVRLKIYLELEIARAYSNINFTEKQWENTSKLYDNLMINNIIATIIDSIPSEEYTVLVKCLYDCADSISKYNTSLAGIMHAISTDQTLTKDNVNELLAKLGDPEQFELIKNVLAKL